MSRNDNLLTKVQKLINNSFNNTVINGSSVFKSDELLEVQSMMAQLMSTFEGQRVYVIDMPVALIPNPRRVEMFVNPALTNLPPDKAISVDTIPFNNFHDITTAISEHLNNNEEVFIYQIQAFKIFTPAHFLPEFRYQFRYKTINMDWWETDRGGVVLNTKLKKPISVGNSVLKHKFL